MYIEELIQSGFTTKVMFYDALRCLTGLAGTPRAEIDAEVFRVTKGLLPVQNKLYSLYNRSPIVNSFILAVNKSGIRKIVGLIKKIFRHAFSKSLSIFCRKINKKMFKGIYLETKESYLKNIEIYHFDDFVISKWKENMKEISDYFTHEFSFSFLSQKTLRQTTLLYYASQKWKNIQKTLIKEMLPKKEARCILREYNVGRPLLNDLEYISSANNIHHLYHLLKFSKETDVNIHDIKSVIEVGGGYGNMAKIFRSANPLSTYSIIDIPVFAYMQAVYLKSIFGDENVHVIEDHNGKIVPGKVNIIPLDKDIVSKIFDGVHIDLFLSTWALSETNDKMQQFIKKLEYFKARYLLLAYQKMDQQFVFAEEVNDVGAAYEKIFNSSTDYLARSYYLFCKRK